VQHAPPPKLDFQPLASLILIFTPISYHCRASACPEPIRRYQPASHITHIANDQTRVTVENFLVVAQAQRGVDQATFFSREHTRSK
jgi:hypothetical protein